MANNTPSTHHTNTNATESENNNYTDFEKTQLTRPRSSTVESDATTATNATNDRSSSFESYLPSEYVNRTTEKRFDARKMGLSKRTFDSALDAMLEETTPGGYTTSTSASASNSNPRPSRKVAGYKHSEYDKFARQITGGSSGKRERSRSRSKGRSKEDPRKGSGGKQRDDDRRKEAEPWGPEAKVRDRVR
jgi:hypothetical protein